MDIQKQIDYWIKGAEEDFAAAKSLMQKGHIRQCLFFAHLAIEKMLKAHVVCKTKDIPPRIHNLIRLGEIGSLVFSSDRQVLLRRFDAYQLAGRYPDAAQIPLTKSIAKSEISKAGEILKWLKAQL